MIDKDRTYRTRDGHEVRIYATYGQEDWPIHGAILKSFGWSSESWTKDGLAFTNMPHADDLVEVRPRHTLLLWLNIYSDGVVRHWATKKEADAMADGVYKRIACIKVELDFEEGEGL